MAPLSCFSLARMRNSREPSAVIALLVSSTRSVSSRGRMISIRLLPIGRIGMSKTPLGLTRRLIAASRSSMRKSVC